jgi:hypothetical protein
MDLKAILIWLQLLVFQNNFQRGPASEALMLSKDLYPSWRSELPKNVEAVGEVGIAFKMPHTPVDGELFKMMDVTLFKLAKHLHNRDCSAS